MSSASNTGYPRHKPPANTEASIRSYPIPNPTLSSRKDIRQGFYIRGQQKKKFIESEFFKPYNSSCHLGATLVCSARRTIHPKRFEDKEFTEDFKYFFLLIGQTRGNILKAL